MNGQTPPESNNDATPPSDGGQVAEQPADNAGPDLSKQVEELTAKLAALEAEKQAQAEKAAEAAKAAEAEKMSAEEKAQAALAEQASALEAERGRLRADRLRLELDARGVKPRLRQFVPDGIDPFTDEGRAALDEFVRANPEFVEDKRDVRPPRPEASDATAKALGTSTEALRRAIENARAVGESEEWIAQKFGTRG